MTQLLGPEPFREAVGNLIARIAGRSDPADLPVLLGIPRGGVYLARRLAAGIEERLGVIPPVGILDITLYRDDLRRRVLPSLRRTEIPVPLTDRRVILVDDVIQTGRTIRAALDALIDLGRPREIELAVLIDRGARETPIEPTDVGARVKAAAEEDLICHFEEEGGGDEVIAVPREREGAIGTRP